MDGEIEVQSCESCILMGVIPYLLGIVVKYFFCCGMCYFKYIYIMRSNCCAIKLYVLILPVLIDLLYKDYNFDQKFSFSTSGSTGLVSRSNLLFNSFQKIFEFIFLITFVFVIESHSHWCEDQ